MKDITPIEIGPNMIHYPSAFSIGEVVRIIKTTSAPGSVGLTGTITHQFPTMREPFNVGDLGEIRSTYTVLLDIGPNGQEAFPVAADDESLAGILDVDEAATV